MALLNATPVFPPTGELFSLPSVPGVQSPPGVPSLPSPTSPAQPTEAELRALPASLGDATTLVPEPSGAEAIGAAPGSSPYFVDAQLDQVAPFNAAPSFPATSDIFTLPGVPGLQSFPGNPALPSSPDIALPTQADLRAILASLPGATAAASGIPDTASSPAVPGSPSYSVGVERAAPAGATPSLEFRPEMVPNLEVSKRPFDPYLIRRDFPILQERVNGRRLVWLDNAATTQKPNAVIDRLSSYYRHENSNVHRASHTLAARATDAYEGASEKVRRFLNASSTREIVFVRGTTEGINLVAQAWGRRYVEKGDQVVITWLEHHSNIVPWQQLCAGQSACLRVAPVDDRGQIMLEQYEKLLGPAHTHRGAQPRVERAGHDFAVRDGRNRSPPCARVLIDGWRSPSRICGKMCRRSIATSLSSPGTKSSRPPGSGSFTEKWTSSIPPRLGRAEAV